MCVCVCENHLITLVDCTLDRTTGRRHTVNDHVNGDPLTWYICQEDISEADTRRWEDAALTPVMLHPLTEMNSMPC